jgi:hypothetical protein
MSGTDTPAAWASGAYLTATVAVVFLLIYRITLGLANSLRPTGRAKAPVREEFSA